MASDTRQPATSAAGTAISGGRNVENAITVVYSVIIRPSRSGKYFFTSGGIRMFVIPTPANTSAVAISSVVAFTATPRATSPTVTAVSAITVNIRANAT